MQIKLVDELGRLHARLAAYLCTSVDGAALGVGGASEIANVSHVFQPSGRSLAPNSKYDFKPRNPCLPAIGKMYPTWGPTENTRDSNAPTLSPEPLSALTWL